MIEKIPFITCVAYSRPALPGVVRTYQDKQKGYTIIEPLLEYLHALVEFADACHAVSQYQGSNYNRKSCGYGKDYGKQIASTFHCSHGNEYAKVK